MFATRESRALFPLLLVCYARISHTVSSLVCLLRKNLVHRFFSGWFVCFMRISRTALSLFCFFATRESRAHCRLWCVCLLRKNLAHYFMAASFFFVTRKSRAVFHVWFVCLLQKNMTHRFFFVVSGLFVCYARISRTISWLLRFFRYVRIPRSVSCLVCLFVTQESRKYFFSGLFACLLFREIPNTFFSVIERSTQASIPITISWICRIN